MATAIFTTGFSVNKQAVWTRSGVYRYKWERKETRESQKGVGYASEAQAAAKADALTATDGVEDVSATLASGGLWEITWTTATVEWTLLETWMGGVQVS